MTSNRVTTALHRAGRKASAAVVIAVAALLVMPQLVAAQPRPSPPDELPAEPLAPAQRDQLFPSQRGGGISREQATEMARARVQGRVVSARTVQMGDRTVHEIRILTDDNRVHIVRIDAQTGAFL